MVVAYLLAAQSVAADDQKEFAAMEAPVVAEEILERTVVGVVGEEKLLQFHSSLVAVASDKTKMDQLPDAAGIPFAA